MLKLVGFAFVASVAAQVPVATANAMAPSPAAPAPTKVADFVPVAPTAATCEVPWPVNGVGIWLNCISETYKSEGEECTFETPKQYKCVYDGVIKCNKEGKFEEPDANGKSKGPNYCTKIPAPVDGQGCARYDRDPRTCMTVDGCHWDGERGWCSINCRKVSCGVELHRRDVACQFNCPLHNVTECTPWQAGCACVQDVDELKDCAAWCQTTNTHEFIWLPTEKTSAASIGSANAIKAMKTTVAESLNFKNEAGYEPNSLCKDACFQRGVCISPKAVIV